jgi:TetR/AcrR family tetracycline transcriptional repressor
MAQRGSLSADRIVEAAMAMLDRDGEKGFSMRRLAGELDADPMALYHHIPNRKALMQAVLSRLMLACPLPEPKGDWRDRVRALCHGLRDLAHRHPGCFEVYVSFEDWVPAEHQVNEAFFSALQDGGFARQETVRAMRLLFAYAETFAVEEITGWLASMTPDEEQALRESLKGGAYPISEALVGTIAQVDADAEFAFGLEVLLRGLEAERDGP